MLVRAAGADRPCSGAVIRSESAVAFEGILFERAPAMKASMVIDDLSRLTARSPSLILSPELRVDRALVDVEERHVVVEHLVQQDDELDQVRVGLLPERFLAPAKEVVQETGDAVGQRVGIEVVVERVVPVGESRLTST